MTEAQIKAKILAAARRKCNALAMACRANAKAQADFRDTLAALQEGCRHRKVKMHSGVHMPRCYECVVCQQEFAEPPEGAKVL